MASNARKISQVSLIEKFEDIDRKFSEIEARLNDLYIKFDQFQRSISKYTQEPTSAQVRILKYVQESSEGSTMKGIQSETGLAKATVSTGLKKLIDIGAVQKVPSTEKDARYKYVIVGELPPNIKKMLELL